MKYAQGLGYERRQDKRHAGFTLIEILVVVVIIGLLAAIAIPWWRQFIANQDAANARNELRQGLLQAQNQSVIHRASWRFTLRDSGDRLLWAVHPNDINWQDITDWNSLSQNIVLDTANTTFATKTGTYYVRFNFKGDVTYRLGTVTVDTRDGVAQNKCIIVSTLIGKIRKGEEHVYPNSNGRYCY